MKVCVLGLWHLGTVTAACLASTGHQVVGLDFEVDNITRLQAGQPPLFEPGLEDLVKHQMAEGRLHFTTDIADAMTQAEIVWVAYDTPVDDADQADVAYVLERVKRLFPRLASGTVVLISSQLPVGSTRHLESAYAAAYPNQPVAFAYSPENLRLGRALSVFLQPDRIVVGVRTEADRARIATLLKPITERVEWMTVESAEMTKHALNAFLATSVTFINEIATLCEAVGADAKEVERGLKSEARIGPKAYLGPGTAFAGGTLARDIAFLMQIGVEQHLPTHLFAAVRASNDGHKHWVRRKLMSLLGAGEAGLAGQTVAVWGLTYKPGTDTLRRSSAVELCEWLVAQGVRVQVHDPAIKVLPPELKFVLCASPTAALDDAQALVLATEWPDYAQVDAATIMQHLRRPLVIDPTRFLYKALGSETRIQHVGIGKALP